MMVLWLFLGVRERESNFHALLMASVNLSYLILKFEREIIC
jgi:hypothetical protein